MVFFGEFWGSYYLRIMVDLTNGIGDSALRTVCPGVANGGTRLRSELIECAWDAQQALGAQGMESGGTQ